MRPDNKKHIFDYAHLLKYPTEGEETYINYLADHFGYDMVIVLLPSLGGKPINEVALKMFTNWGIGKHNNSKGILMLLAGKEKLIKVEVGYGAEGIFNDGFCGYIERLQMQSYFKGNRLDEGLIASLEEFAKRLRGEFPDMEVERRVKAHDANLSGGAGIKKDVVTGVSSEFDRVSEQDKIHFSAQQTPEETFQRYLEALQRNIHNPDLGIYSEGTGVFWRFTPRPTAEKIQEVYKLYAQTHEVVEQGDYAVVIFPADKHAWPFFLKKSSSGWQIDLISMRKWMRENATGGFLVLGDAHPYMFVFKDKRYADRVFDINLYDDYGLQSTISSNYGYWIDYYKDTLKKNPQDFTSLISLSEIFFDLALQSEALPLLKKAQQIEPLDSRPYKYLGLLYRDALSSPLAALDYLKKYSALVPDDPDGYMYISDTYFHIAEYNLNKNPEQYYRKAAEYALKYAEYASSRLQGYLYAGYFYWKAKDYVLAKEWFNASLRISPDNPYALAKLQEIAAAQNK